MYYKQSCVLIPALLTVLHQRLLTNVPITNANQMSKSLANKTKLNQYDLASYIP